MDASTAGAAAPANPFEQALVQSMHFFPTPPSSYKYRLGAQIAICALLMTVSLVYIILHYLHARNTGMPFWIFKLQKNPKTKWGRPLAINSMLAFTALAFLSGGGQLGSRYYEWMVFIEGRKPLGYTAAAFTPWVPAFVQAWFFSITNLHATVAARGKLGSRFRGITNPLVHNFVLVGIPIVYVVMILPIALTTSAKQDQVFRDTWSLEPLLRTAAAAFDKGIMPSPELLYQLSQIQAKLQAELHSFKQNVVVLCALCLALSAILGIMNACNLLLVWTLRVNASSVKRDTQTWSSSNLTAHATPQQVAELGVDWEQLGVGSAFKGNTGPATVADSSLRSAMPAKLFDTTAKAQDHESNTAFAASPQDIALRRLAADLTITIPCLLAMVIVMVVGLSVLIEKQFEHLTWTIQEYTMDGFCWIYTIISLLAVCFLIVNLLRAWQIQRAVSPLSTPAGSAEKASPAPPTTSQQASAALSPVAETKEENSDALERSSLELQESQR